MLPAGDISVGEALEKNSKQRNSHESSGQLLDGSCIFYHLFHPIVRPYTPAALPEVISDYFGGNKDQEEEALGMFT